MLYTKDGFPDVNEIVLCRVTKIYGNSTFVFIPEYEKEGVLTISEIAPGRIRNLRDHVTESKEIVCKVLRVDPKFNRIDVSLRRVSLTVKKNKLEEIKKEEYADRIYVDVAKEVGIEKDTLFEQTYEPIFDEYATVFEALYEIMLDNKKVEMFKVDKKTKDAFLKVINERIKPEEVELQKSFKLSSIAATGAILIKDTIKKSLEKINSKKVNVVYLAAGEFRFTIKHDDMKSADIEYQKFIKELESLSKQNKLKLETK